MLIVFEHGYPVLDIGSTVLRKLLPKNSGIATEESGSHFRYQFFFAVSFRGEADNPGYLWSVQPLMVSGRMDQIMEEYIIVALGIRESVFWRKFNNINMCIRLIARDNKKF